MRGVLNELVGLFVDDGLLAVGLVAWCGAVGAGRTLLPAMPAWGPLLALGCAAILLVSVLRSARSR